MRKVAISVLAHPDDAEIFCAGTLIRLKDLGWEVHIATMTPGDCGSVSQDRWAISAARVLEARKAASLIGATYHCLDERDVVVCYDKPTIMKVIDLFRKVAPTLLLTHAPRDYMLDHDMTSAVARAASFGFAAPNVSTVPMAPDCHVPYLYYCDPMEAIDPYGVLVKPSTYVDMSKQIETKTAMLAAHASQREWLRAHHGMDEYLDAMKRHGELRGKEIGVKYAEAFIQHRGHGHPRNDIFAELLK